MASSEEDLKTEINNLKQELAELKSRYEEMILTFPDLVQENLTLALKDYKYLNDHSCLGCCSKRK